MRCAAVLLTTLIRGAIPFQLIAAHTAEAVATCSLCTSQAPFAAIRFVRNKTWGPPRSKKMERGGPFCDSVAQTAVTQLGRFAGKAGLVCHVFI